MPLVADRCLCLRKIEYSETSQILTLLGRESGLVRVIAKGAHRTTKAGASKFGGGIDLLDLADAVFSHAPHKDLPPLAEWQLIDGRRALRRSLRAIYLGTYAAELTTALLEEHDPHPNLFDQMHLLLEELTTPRIEQAFVAFQLHLLREAGLTPEWARCASCGRSSPQSGAAYFATGAGGLICSECEPRTPQRLMFDARLLSPIRVISALVHDAAPPQRLPMLSRHQSDPINRLIAEHAQFTAGRRLRLPAYVMPRRG
jgi:DNA repair protein RecO (recombination protein O)